MIHKYTQILSQCNWHALMTFLEICKDGPEYALFALTSSSCKNDICYIAYSKTNKYKKREWFFKYFFLEDIKIL